MLSLFFQAEWISEVNLKSGSEDKTAAGHDPQIPQVYFCVFTDVRKPGLNKVFFLNVFIYCWAARCVGVTEDYFIPKSMQPPRCTIQTSSPSRPFVTLKVYSFRTNCCLACFLISDSLHHGPVNPLTCIVTILMIDLSVCLWMLEWTGDLDMWIFWDFLLKKKKSPCLVIVPLNLYELSCW